MSDEQTTQQDNTRQRRKGRRQPRDGEIGIRYGNRNFIRTPDQTLVSRYKNWHLVAVPSMSKDGWWNFKLYLNKKFVSKNLWQLGMKKGALARNRDNALLNEHNPEIVPWVLEQAKLYADGKLVHRKEQGKPVIYRKGKGWMLYKGKNNG